MSDESIAYPFSPGSQAPLGNPKREAPLRVCAPGEGCFADGKQSFLRTFPSGARERGGRGGYVPSADWGQTAPEGDVYEDRRRAAHRHADALSEEDSGWSWSADVASSPRGPRPSTSVTVTPSWTTL